MQNARKSDKTSQDKDVIIERLTAENAHLKLELEILRRFLSGKKTERFVEEPKEQLRLGFFPEIIEVKSDDETVSININRKKHNTVKPAIRTVIPEHLPRIKETIEPENVPDGAVKIGSKITEVLEFKPCKIFVRHIIRPQYAIPNPQKKEDFDSEKVIITAELPSDLPIVASNASASILTYLIVSKFVDHLPFYRIIQIFKRLGLDIPSSTVNDWFKNACKLLEPLYLVLMKITLESAYIQVDESPISVQTKEKAGCTHKGYMWVYHSPPDGYVFFDYAKGRGKEHPKKILDNYKGTIQTDGYASYNQFSQNLNIRLAACGAHARRKFYEAQKENPQVCNYVLGEFQKIYAIEREIREEDLSPDAIQKIRGKQSKPIMDGLEVYLREKIYQVLPKSSTGKAIAYTLNLWNRLTVFLDDPAILFDNNLIENSIRPLALGRKNFLFAGSHEAAQRVAMMYSFFGTCKHLGVEPSEWLKATLEKISSHKVNKLHELLPGYKAQK